MDAHALGRPCHPLVASLAQGQKRGEAKVRQSKFPAITNLLRNASSGRPKMVQAGPRLAPRHRPRVRGACTYAAPLLAALCLFCVYDRCAALPHAEARACLPSAACRSRDVAVTFLFPLTFLFPACSTRGGGCGGCGGGGGGDNWRCYVCCWSQRALHRRAPARDGAACHVGPALPHANDDDVVERGIRRRRHGQQQQR